MKYFTIKPSEKLADVVRYFWVFEGTATESLPYIHRTLASGCPELLFHYEGTFHELTFDGKLEPSFLTGIHGQTDQFKQFIVTEKFGIFGAYLYPYALSTLFDIPAIELTNQLPDLHSIVKKCDIAIEEKMFSAPDTITRTKILTAFLEKKLRTFERPEIAFAVKSILETHGQVNLHQLTDRCHLSARQFERKFKEHTGFSAKTFSRIVRFNAVIGQQKPLDGSLTDMAYHFGYYDQSHFIQDFKTFSGYSPGAYFKGKAGELLSGG